MKITEKQAKFILRNYCKICKIAQKMNQKIQKSFAVDGRMLGDIGECILAYAFDLRLNEKQRGGFDAETKNGKKVEIKVRTNKNHIHISNSTVKNVKKDGCHLLVAEIDRFEKIIKIVINSELQSKVEDKRNNGFIPRNKLKLYCKGRGLKLIHDNIGCWKILTESN